MAINPLNLFHQVQRAFGMSGEKHINFQNPPLPVWYKDSSIFHVLP